MSVRQKSLFAMIMDMIRQNGGVEALFKEVPPTIGHAAEKAASKVGGALVKTAGSIGSFVEWWRRKNGEPITSIPVALKMFSVLAAYGLYRRFDPLPDRKADNVAILGIASYLIGLLLFPKSGDAALEFTEKVRLGAEGLSADVQTDVLRWANDLTSEQKKKLDELFEKGEFTPEDFSGFLQSETVRDLLTKMVPVEAQGELAAFVSLVKNFFGDLGVSLSSKYQKADTGVAQVIANIHRAVIKS